MQTFRGIITPLATPFDEKLEVDMDATRWLSEFQVRSGVHGIFLNSTTGEFVHLKPEESLEIARNVIEVVGGRTKIIAGISTNCTEHSIELGRRFKDVGVDRAVITPPFFFKIGVEGMRVHFSKVAERVDLPIIVYNVPPATGITIPVELYVELTKEHSNVVAAKVAFDSIAYMRRLVREVKAVRRDFSVLTGLDDHLLPTLAIGGDGGTVALANFAPQLHLRVYTGWVEVDVAKALESYRRLLKLARIYELTSSLPTAVKTVPKLLNAPVRPYVRPPLVPEGPRLEEEVLRECEIPPF